MKRTTIFATALLAAGLAGWGCVHEEHSTVGQTGSARGETMQATGAPGIGAKNSTGTTPTGTVTGNTTTATGSPAPASTDAARAELHAKDAAATSGTAVQADLSDQAQLAADKEKEHEDKDDKDAKHPADAVAKVKPSEAAPKDMQVTGKVKFIKAEHGVKVIVNLKGLKPNSKHGFHIHEKNDLSAPDLKSAGPHFNPGGKKHGGPEGDERHGGDLGNLTADEKGNVKTEIMAHGITIDGEKDGILNRSIIVHAKPDDLKSDPSGESGDRIAGGAIEKPKKDDKEKEKEKEKEKSADATGQVKELEVTDKPASVEQELNK